jgi:hypothetical protein
MAVRRDIELGLRNAGMVEVVSGLERRRNNRV